MWVTVCVGFITARPGWPLPIRTPAADKVRDVPTESGVLAGCGLSPEKRDDLPGDEARVGVGCKEHVRRCDLFGLGRPLHRSVFPERCHVLGVLRRGVERSPDRTGRNSV